MLERSESLQRASRRQLPVALVIVALLISGGIATNAVAQRRSSQTDLAVDVVRLRSGERLLGAVFGNLPDGTVRMAVQRGWLRETLPEYYRSVVADEAAAQRSVTEGLIERIDRWVSEVEARPGSGNESRQLLGFLKDQRQQLQERLDQLKADSGEGGVRKGLDTQFLLLDLPRNRVASRFVQPAERRRIALLSWRERFREVETQTVDQLLEALESRKIDVADDGQPVDLSDRVPPEAQSDVEWAARQAIVEFVLGQRLEYQGISGALIRTDGDAPQVDLAAVLPQLLQSQLTSQLADLLNEPGLGNAAVGKAKPAGAKSTAALGPAIRGAEQLGRRGFRVTQLDLDLPRGQARVTEQFVARLPGGNWKVVWSEMVTEDARKARDAAEEQIANDPQVKQLLQLAEQLGGAGDQVKTAVRFGAATMAAQQAASARFFAFRDRHTQRLDGPPLTAK
jgi:hypothetical protein